MRRRIIRFAAVVILAGLALAGSAAWWLFDLPDVTPLKTKPPKTTAYMELRKRQAKERGEKLDLRWTWVPYDEISDNLKKAVVMAEDDEFWRHDGIDRNALRAALDRAISERKLTAGGSTITMQLARNLYLSPAKNPLRKAKEILIARRLEKVLGKRRILELYLNVAEWGRGVFGCEAAARAYFDAACAEVNPEEAVGLAVVLPNPRRWNPLKRGAYVERNSRRIITRMKASGWWTEDQATDDAELYSGSTTAILSTGSAESDQGRKPVTEE